MKERRDACGSLRWGPVAHVVFCAVGCYDYFRVPGEGGLIQDV